MVKVSMLHLISLLRYQEKCVINIEKLKYLKNEKSFLDEIRTFFKVFEGLS